MTVLEERTDTAWTASPVGEGDGLPEGWARATLAEVCELNPGKPPKDALPSDAPVTFVPMAAVDAESGTISSPTARRFSDVRSGFTAFQEGDVIMAKITPCMENGKAAIARGLVNGMGFGSTEFHVLRPTPAVLPEYVFHYVRQESFRKAAAETMTAAVGQARVPASFVQSAELPLPPLAEQRRIVAQVEALLARQAAAREWLATVPFILKRFRQTVLSAAFAGRLTEERRENLRNSQHIQDKARRSVDAANAPSVDTAGLPELPEFPEEWPLSRVGDTALLIQYGTSDKADATSSAGVPILRMGNIQEGRLVLSSLKFVDLRARNLEAFVLRPGDLLFNRTNSPELVGKAAVFEADRRMVFASYLVRVQVDQRLAHPEFLCYWINSPWGREWAQAAKTDGVSQSNINATKLAAMPVPLPPVREQHEIVRRVNALFNLAGAIERRVGAATARADKLGQAILGKAFRGELVPTEAQLAHREGRDYEPASLLVEPIRAKRARPGAKGVTPGRPLHPAAQGNR